MPALLEQIAENAARLPTRNVTGQGDDLPGPAFSFVSSDGFMLLDGVRLHLVKG